MAVRNATLISLLWAPPLASESNGIITGYSIQGTVEMGETVQFTTTATSLEFTAQPYKSYEFVVAAKTTVGRGPFSPEESVQTPEIGKTGIYILNTFLSPFFFFFIFSSPNPRSDEFNKGRY